MSSNNNIRPENLSSDTLFTFTSKLEYLILTLNHGIVPRYIFEKIRLGSKQLHYIVPAKCFCDIPLGKIKAHLEFFGNYGLGISKKYLREKSVTPVLYIHGNSNRFISSNLGDFSLDRPETYPASLPLLKRYFGEDYKFNDNGEYERRLRKFYDEREWRYIPTRAVAKLSEEKIDLIDGLSMVKRLNKEQPFEDGIIPLTPDTIEYIIINKVSDFVPLKLEMKKIFEDEDTYQLMLSKILIVKRILRDF